MAAHFGPNLSLCPLLTLLIVTTCSLLLLPFVASEITHQYMITVEGTAMPSWCHLGNNTVPDFADDRAGSLLSCGGACSRTKNCQFFCITGSTCDTFKSQVAPYFQGWTDEPHTVYDVCYTAWPGDPLNIITPNLTVTGSPYQSGSHPKFVNDGFICGKKVAPGFRSENVAGPQVTLDLGITRQISVLKYLVLAAGPVGDLRIAFGESMNHANNKIIVRKDVPTADEEVFEFDPAESGRFLTFFRETTGGKLFVGDVTAYT